MTMSPKNSPEDNGALGKLLREWKVESPLPPRFEDHVWQRIAREELPALAGFWTQLAHWIGSALARPSLAAGYVALLLAAGLLAGYCQARAEKGHALEMLSSRYVQMVDPYQAPRRYR